MKHPRKGFVQIIIAVIVVLAIGAGAMFVYQKYSQKPTLSPTQTTANNNPTQTINKTSPSPVTSDETAGWKTYTNTAEKITFKYPNDWDTVAPSGKEDPTLVTVRSPIVIDSPSEPLRYLLTIIVAPTQQNSVSEAMDSTIAQIKSQNPNYPQINTEKIKVGNQEAELTTDLPSQGGSIQIYIIYNKRLYQLTFLPYDPKKAEWRSREFRRTLDNILSTFKFTN
jgi:hypothetical protein